MAKAKKFRMRARMWVKVDDVDMEQESIENGIKRQNEQAISAARKHKSMAGIIKTAEENNLEVRVNKAHPSHGGWTVVFSVGMESPAQ